MYIDEHEENILPIPDGQESAAEAPAAEAPVTEAPVTEAPAAEAPVTEAPVTEAPVTEAPAAEAPVEAAPVQAPAPARPKKKRLWPKVIAAVLVCALVGGAAGFGGAMLAQRFAVPAVAPDRSTVIYQGEGTPVTVSMAKPSGKVLSPAEVYASNVNSVVGITTQVTTNIWGQRVSAPAAGSGFVLTQDGYIVTNYHVVEGARSISVQFKNGDKFDARVVGTEEDNDVAVLKIDATGLTPVRLGASADLVVGEDVVAIGNPLGEMTFSMTRGIVSALDKALTMTDGTVINVLQTDAAINSGNSGGPLFNMYGQVIGITNAKYSNNGSSDAAIEGICFAIPIDDIKDILTDLIEHGYVTGKPYVGVTLATTDAAQAAKYGRHGGAYVQSVIPGGAADQAGLKQGDIITAVDGETIDGHAAFIDIKNTHRAGDTVTLTVDREAKLITLSLTFGEQQPDDSSGQISVGNSRGDGYDDDYDYDWDDYYDYYSGRGYSFNPFDWFGW